MERRLRAKRGCVREMEHFGFLQTCQRGRCFPLPERESRPERAKQIRRDASASDGEVRQSACGRDRPCKGESRSQGAGSARAHAPFTRQRFSVRTPRRRNGADKGRSGSERARRQRPYAFAIRPKIQQRPRRRGRAEKSLSSPKNQSPPPESERLRGKRRRRGYRAKSGTRRLFSGALK